MSVGAVIALLSDCPCLCHSVAAQPWPHLCYNHSVTIISIIRITMHQHLHTTTPHMRGHRRLQSMFHIFLTLVQDFVMRCLALVVATHGAGDLIAAIC